MKISIIVVTFNNEPDIGDAVRSCIVPGKTDYEVIVVYNKSEDKTLDALRSSIAGHASLFKIIENSENVGLGEARNQGIRAAKGEYIVFLDGDDWFAPNGIMRLESKLSENMPEILYYNFARVYADGWVVHNNKPKTLAEGWRSTPERRASLLRNFGVAWTRAYCSKFLRSHNLRFPLGLYEDFLWNIEVLARAEKVYVIPDAITFYRQRDGSILRSHGIQHLDSLLAHRRVIDFFKKNQIYVESFASRSYKAVRRQGYGMLTSGRLPWHMRRRYLIQVNGILAELRLLFRRNHLSFEEKVASLESYILYAVYVRFRGISQKVKRRIMQIMH